MYTIFSPNYSIYLYYICSPRSLFAAKKAVQLNQTTLAMEEAVQLSVQERSDTPEGANDFACLADVPSRLRVITMARRMPNIISQIPFDDDAIPTKPVLAKILRNILKVPSLQRTNAQICFIMCILKETLFFQQYGTQFSPHKIIELCRNVTYQVIRKGQCLYTLGERGEHISIVLSGALETRSRLGSKRNGGSVTR